MNLLVKSDGPITRITLNRPEKRNAMSFDLMAELTSALEAVRHDSECRRRREVKETGRTPCEIAAMSTRGVAAGRAGTSIAHVSLL